jgi:hypothetical protein
MLLGCEPATVARASVILMVLGFGCMLLCCMLRAFMLHVARFYVGCFSAAGGEGVRAAEGQS